MVLTDLGTVYGREGKHQQAIEMFKKALKIYPNYKDALINLGMAYYMTTKADEACADFKAAFDLGFEKAGELMRDLCKQNDN